MRIVISGLLVFFASLLCAQSEGWTPLGPGGGATTTTIHCDNVRKDNYWVGTRTHGLYHSKDGGKSWLHRGKGLGNAVVSAIETEPLEIEHEEKKHRPKRGKPGPDDKPRTGLRVYAGTARGLYVSHNLGIHWELCPDTKDAPIGAILVNPYNVDQVWAIEGWTTLDDQIVELLAEGEEITGVRRVWVSNDRGKSFKAQKYESKSGYRRAYSIVQHPSDPDQLYLGAHSGVYYSKNSGKSWKRLKDPKRSKSGVKAKTREDGCRGVDISPSGEWIAAVYANADGDYRPYLADTRKHSWTETGNDLPSGGGRRRNSFKNEFSTPRFVQTMQGLSLVLGQLFGSRLGLYGGLVNVDDKEPSAEIKQICQSPDEDRSEEEFKFRMGWTKGAFRVRAIDIAPEFWGKSTIAFSTTETVIAGWPDQNGFPTSYKSWRDLGAIRPEEKGARGHHNLGMQANDIRDIAIDGRYMIAAGVGNGLIESFNSGKSWSLAKQPFDGAVISEAVAIIPESKPIVIAHVNQQQRRGGDNHILYAKKLLNRDNDDEWIKIGGGSQTIGGLHNRAITAIRPHRSRLGQVALGTKEDGVWYTTSFERLMDEAGGEWENITDGSALEKAHIIEIEQDFVERDTFWVLAKGKKSGLWRGDLKGKKWKWKLVHSIKAETGVGGLATWREGDLRRVAIAYPPSSKEGAAVWLGKGECDEFKIVARASEIAARHSEKEFRALKDEKDWQVSSLAALNGEIFVSIKDPTSGIGLGVARLKLQEGTVSIGIWNGNLDNGLHQGVIARIIPYFIDKKPHIFVAMPGAGIAKREVDSFSETPLIDDNKE